MGGKFPFFHLINHTEMMWSTFFFFHTDFTACLHGVSPLLIKLKAHLFNPPPRTILRQNMRNYRIELSLWCKLVSVGKIKLNELVFCFFCSFSVSSSHGVQSHLLPLWFYLQHLLSRHPFIFYTSALLSLPLPSPPSVLLVCGQRYQALSINSEAIR